jgi:hypothetical protein
MVFEATSFPRRGKGSGHRYLSGHCVEWVLFLILLGARRGFPRADRQVLMLLGKDRDASQVVRRRRSLDGPGCGWLAGAITGATELSTSQQNGWVILLNARGNAS